MKTVLWISRHEMTDAQRADLERIMEGPVRLLPWRNTVRDVSALVPAVERSDAVAAVFPPGLMAEEFRANGTIYVQDASAYVKVSDRLRKYDKNLYI